MRLIADPLVDWGALGKVVWVAAAGGLGLMIVFSLAVVGAVQATEYRRADQPIIAAVFTALTLACLAACAAVLYVGFHFVVTKPA